MAKIVITIEDTGVDVVGYKSECETPEETREDGQPTLALQMAGMIMSQIIGLHTQNQSE